MKPTPLIPLALFLALAFAGLSPARAQSTPDDAPEQSSARPEVEKLIKESGAEVTVVFRSLDGSQQLFIKPDLVFDDRDALRIPVMIELYAQADAGLLKLSDPAPPIGPAGTVTGPPETLRDLCEEMIVSSSDPATNRLIERLGVTNIRQRIGDLGAAGMSIAAPFPSHQENHTTARALFTLLYALATDRAVSSEASKEMVDLLSRSPLHLSPDFPSQPAPPKPMDASNIHDAAIMFGARSFVFVIQIRGMTDGFAGAALLAKITHALSAAM